MNIRIEHKARELFMRYGFRAITMDEIASNLGISKKTIYHYYTDKKYLVSIIVEKDLKLLKEDCVQQRKQATDPVDEVIRNLESVEGLLSAMNPQFLFELERGYPEAFKAFLQYKNVFLLKAIKDNLVWGLEEALYRPCINVDVMSHFRLESIFMAFDQNIFPAAKFHLYKVVQETAFNFLYGIVTTKGRRLIEHYLSKNEKQLLV